MYRAKISQYELAEKLWPHQNEKKKWNGVSDDVSSQIHCICNSFIKEKLKIAGLFTKKVSILIDGRQLRQLHSIFPILLRMSVELERLHPRTFSNISINLPEDDAPVMIETIGKSLFKHNDITWGKIISFLTISSAFAADCVKVGQSDVQPIIDSTFSTLLEEAGVWIDKEGGWASLCDYIRPIGSEHITFVGFLTVLVGFLLAVHWSVVILKSLSKIISNIF